MTDPLTIPAGTKTQQLQAVVFELLSHMTMHIDSAGSHVCELPEPIVMTERVYDLLMALLTPDDNADYLAP